MSEPTLEDFLSGRRQPTPIDHAVSPENDEGEFNLQEAFYASLGEFLEQENEYERRFSPERLRADAQAWDRLHEVGAFTPTTFTID